ncbi:MAG: hypothetical protein R3F61_02400 [Myxococcota bacterium]
MSEHLLRECLYGLNAELLRARPGDEGLAQRLVAALVDRIEREGPRFHEPTLMADWAEAAALEPEELRFELEQAFEMVIEELDDDEEPWSAHRLLELAAEEPFWVLRWSQPGEGLPSPTRPVRGVPVPLSLRPRLVRILDELEITLFDARQALRSVHDAVPESTVSAALDRAIDAISRLSDGSSSPDARGPSPRPSGAPRDPLRALLRPGDAGTSLRTALRTIQRWKLSVHFDASPDDDDGEWTLRVLERLYEIEWVEPVSSGTSG